MARPIRIQYPGRLGLSETDLEELPPGAVEKVALACQSGREPDADQTIPQAEKTAGSTEPGKRMTRSRQPKCHDSRTDPFKVGLSIGDYKFWLKPEGKKYVKYDDRVELEKQICIGDKFSIPNQVLIVVGDQIAATGSRKMANYGVQVMQARGFSVAYYDYNIQQVTGNTITDYVASGNLWGFSFFGHGVVNWNPLDRASNGGFNINHADDILYPSSMLLSRRQFGDGKTMGSSKYGLVIAFMCSASSASWSSLSSGEAWQSPWLFQPARNFPMEQEIRDTFKRASAK